MRDVGRPAAIPAIDRYSIVPIYQQIYEDLREAILTGTLPESTRLPPERTLAERLSINRSTVVQAYRELVADGLLEQRVGSGSRVTRSHGQPARGEDVPWWVTLPPWRVGRGRRAQLPFGDHAGFARCARRGDPAHRRRVRTDCRALKCVRRSVG